MRKFLSIYSPIVIILVVAVAVGIFLSISLSIRGEVDTGEPASYSHTVRCQDLTD